MLFKTLISGLLLFGLIYSPKLVTRGFKRHKEEQLLEISSKFAGIKWKYFGWAILLIVPIVITTYGGWAVASLYPALEENLRLFFGLVGVSYVPIYQSIFALLTNVYPVSKWEDFVISEAPSTRLLALRGLALVFALLAIMFVLVFVW